MPSQSDFDSQINEQIAQRLRDKYAQSLGGVSTDDIIAKFKQMAPDNYKDAYGKVGWKIQHPVESALNNAASQLKASGNDTLGGIYNNANKLLMTGGPSINPLESARQMWTNLASPVGDAAQAVADGIHKYGLDNSNSIVGKVAMSAAGGGLLSNAQLVAGAIRGLTNPDAVTFDTLGAGAAMEGWQAAKAAMAANASEKATAARVAALLPPALVNDGPQGSLVPKILPPVPEVPPLTARELGTSKLVSTPGVHNQAARTIIQNALDSFHDYAQEPYLELQKPQYKSVLDSNFSVPTNFTRAIEPFKDQFESLPDELKTGPLGKWLRVGQPLSDEALGAKLADPNAGEITRKDLGQVNLTGINGARSAFLQIARDNPGTKKGAFAVAATDGLSKDYAANAPQEIKELSDLGAARWAELHSRFYNDPVQAFLSRPNLEAAHDVLMGGERGNSEAVKAITAAGGPAAIANIQKSHLYDMIGQLAGSSDAEKAFLKYQFAHADAMNALYPNGEQQDFHALSQQIDASREAYEAAVKTNATSEKAASELAAADDAKTALPKTEAGKEKTTAMDVAKKAWSLAKLGVTPFHPGVGVGIEAAEQAHKIITK